MLITKASLVVIGGVDVLGAEVLVAVLAEPDRKLGHLFAHGDGERTAHVGLSEKFRENAWQDVRQDDFLSDKWMCGW